MSQPVILIGDKTDHGGLVIGGTATSDVDGKRIARVGDAVRCRRCGKRNNVIVTGDPSCLVDGQPVARHGDKAACGATLIASQALTTD